MRQEKCYYYFSLLFFFIQCVFLNHHCMPTKSRIILKPNTMRSLIFSSYALYFLLLMHVLLYYIWRTLSAGKRIELHFFASLCLTPFLELECLWSYFCYIWSDSFHTLQSRLLSVFEQYGMLGILWECRNKVNFGVENFKWEIHGKIHNWSNVNYASKFTFFFLLFCWI